MLIPMPQPYPHETIYSICARFTERMRFPTRQSMNQLLFGFEHQRKRISIDFPNGLGHIADHYPHMDVEQLIAKHTALPFYAPFISPEPLARVHRQMVGNGKRGVGLIKDGGCKQLAFVSSLRYCPECVKAERQQYGETYWNRLHQLPGILLCSKHRCWLELSDVTLGKNERCVTAESSIRPSDQLIARYITDDKQLLLVLADNATRLLESERIEYPKDEARTRYTVAMTEQGYATYNGLTRIKQLSTAFIDHYSEETMAQFGLVIKAMKSTNALIQLIQSHRTKHPIHHLLLIMFLGYDTDQFFGRDPHVRPFGEPPWPCLNSMCDQYRQLVIETCALGMSKNLKSPLGTFICPQCGFCYSRSGMDATPLDRYKIGLLRTHGHLWDDKLRHYWDEHDGRAKVIADAMFSSEQTVMRNAQRLGLNNHPKYQHSQRFEDIPTPENLEEYRHRWLGIIAKNQGVLMSTLRKQYREVCLWLVRHDLQWFREHTPDHRKAHKLHHVDWEKRDKQLAGELEGAVAVLRREIPSVRITRTSLGTKIGANSMFRQSNLDKLPYVAKILEEVVETSEQFTLRRLEGVVEGLAREGKFVTRSQLVRVMGLHHKPLTERVEREMNRLLEAYKPP